MGPRSGPAGAPAGADAGRVPVRDWRTVIARDRLVAELARLRQGRGVAAPDLAARLGSDLSALAGVRPDDDAAAARQKLAMLLEPGVQRLPPDLQVCVQAALALPPAPAARFLRTRLEWAGTMISRDRRTVLRRVDEGLRLLAAELTGPARPSHGARYAPDGWRVEEFHATLWMDRDPPLLNEHRRIAATRDGLSRIMIGFSAPVREGGGPPMRGVTQVDGGVFAPDPRLSTASYLTGWLELPRALDAGQRHEYELLVAGPPRDEMRPYYVFTPLWPCDRFSLVAVFDPARPPARIWTVDGLPTRPLDDFAADDAELRLDAAGRLELGFDHPQVGLSYGIQWSW